MIMRPSDFGCAAKLTRKVRTEVSDTTCKPAKKANVASPKRISESDISDLITVHERRHASKVTYGFYMFLSWFLLFLAGF